MHCPVNISINLGYVMVTKQSVYSYDTTIMVFVAPRGFRYQ